jgi:hypothetical protein
MTCEEIADKFVERIERDVQNWIFANEEYFENVLNVSIKIKVWSEDSCEERTYEI